jgi:NADPH-dependent 2,4-dienoyl-CoA reductase/sulfur reductase-like enzyme
MVSWIKAVPNLNFLNFLTIEKDSNVEKIKIIVVGAGLGGLGVAISCAQAGHEVEVLEAAREISEVSVYIHLYV